ncbi:hypothetical protein M090_2670 [Parabacteroides distasonis str. 3776 Po2 i]|nr:hypothetical protein M090_2670 [Parabacteroides distasonis str. 3776 Po2 i]
MALSVICGKLLAGVPLSMLAARRKASWVWLSTGVIYPPMKPPSYPTDSLIAEKLGNEQNLPKAIEV